MKRLDSKVAVITGGGSGIGAATAALFVREGARVVLVGRTEDRLRKVVDEIGGDHASYVVADVAKVEDTERYINETVARHDRLDVLVSNAGYEGPLRMITEHTVEEFDQVMATNVRGAWLSIKLAFPHLAKRGGSVILTASISGVAGFGGHSAYTASKHGVIGLARALAHDGAPHKIRVNAVCPGVIDNDMMASLHTKLAPGAEAQMKSVVAARVPLKRYGGNEEIAWLNVFLASDESSYCTGGVYTADGGLTAGIM